MINWYLEQINALAAYLEADKKDTFWIVTLVLFFLIIPGIAGFIHSLFGKDSDD